MRRMAILLIAMVAASPCLGFTWESVSVITPEVKALSQPKTLNFMQEIDMTFWQTMPFGLMWGYFADQQISNLLNLAEAPHWGPILCFSAAVSLWNAYRHSQKVMESERAGNSN